MRPIRLLILLLAIAIALALALVRPLQVRATRAEKRHQVQQVQLLRWHGPWRHPRRHRQTAAEVLGHHVVTYARHFIGIPYSWGGSSPRTGFDCSGLARFASGPFGIPLRDST